MNLHFYYCELCGKVITVLSDTGIPTDCCGQAMEELVPNTADGAGEKHVPVVTQEGGTVTVRVGSVPHPMTEAHRITWIGLRTAHGFQFKELEPGDLPVAVFTVSPTTCPEAVYAYCNLHSLWCWEKEAGR